MKKTKKEYEQHLNASYADAYSQSEAMDNFAYMTHKSRQKRTTMKNIMTAFTNHTLGFLLRRYDSIAFHTGYNLWAIPCEAELLPENHIK